jgi:hypothetical protein
LDPRLSLAQTGASVTSPRSRLGIYGCRAVWVAGIIVDDGGSSRRFPQGSTRRPFAVSEDPGVCVAPGWLGKAAYPNPVDARSDWAPRTRLASDLGPHAGRSDASAPLM